MNNTALLTEINVLQKKKKELEDVLGQHKVQYHHKVIETEQQRMRKFK